MRETLTFFGVLLCILSGITEGMPNETYACGNKSKHCDEYCNLCGQSSRTSCFELSHDLLCYSNFKQTMDQFNSTDLCLWNMVQTPYNTFTECSEGMADCLLIPWPNPAVEDAFVKIHTMYFQNCVTEGLRDPPPSILFALVMTPICLIPAMVFLVVLKTKNGDGRS